MDHWFGRPWDCVEGIKLILPGSLVRMSNHSSMWIEDPTEIEHAKLIKPFMDDVLFVVGTKESFIIVLCKNGTIGWLTRFDVEAM